MSGLSFGSQDTSPSTRVGVSDCQTAAWVSGTSLACQMSLGVGISLAVHATVSSVAGTQTAIFTYDGAGQDCSAGASIASQCERHLDLPALSRRYVRESHKQSRGVTAPVVSFSEEANAAVIAGDSMTVSGLSFGAGATTPTVTVGLSSCVTAAWASASSVVCMVSAGEGATRDIRVTVVGVVGSRTSAFSYDGLHLMLIVFNNLIKTRSIL